VKTASLLLIGVIGLACAEAAAASRLNVLLIMADDLRDSLGCYGNPAVRTPNLDRLAARGVLFERAYAQYPVCNPSRASLLTGMRPEATGIARNAIIVREQLPDVVTFPELLRRNGWRAESYGKIFHVEAGDEPEWQRRMDVGRSWDSAMFPATTRGKHQLDGRNLTGGKLAWCEWGAMDGNDDDQPDGQVAREAIAALDRLARSEAPWLIAAGFQRPHDPFVAPRKYFDLYPSAAGQIHSDPPDVATTSPLAFPSAELRRAFGRFGDAERREFLRAYYACVTFMDAQVGRLLDAVDRLALWDRTVIVFVSDHGYHHNERGWWNKGTLFEPSGRVPFIVAAPGVRPRRTNSVVELLDLYPTIADYCELQTPASARGKSCGHLPRAGSFPVRRSPPVRLSSAREASMANRFAPPTGGLPAIVMA
jgi:iduronate 2-sulfatase